MVRIAATCLIPAAALAVLVGCGNSKPAAHGGPAAPLWTAQAEATNLRQGDVPGMSLSSYGGMTAQAAIGVPLRRCGGTLPNWEAGSLRSAKFAPHSPSHEVWSAIRLVPTPTAAARDVAGNRTARVRNCFARVFAAAVAERGPLVNERTSASGLPTALRGDGSFGLRLTHRVSYLEAHPHPRQQGFRGELEQTRSQIGSFSLDILGFASDRYEVTLMDLHAPDVAAVQSEQRLLSLLYRRARKL